MAVAISPKISTSSYDGPALASQITNSRTTKYLYNYRFDLSWTGASGTKELWIPTLSNRTLLSQDGTMYQQEVSIINNTNTSSGPIISNQTMEDEHGNKILYFHLNINGAGSFQLNILAHYILRDVEWTSNASTFNYNTSDPTYIRYTKEELYINKSYAPIAGNASSLNDTNPFTAAKNIYDFVTGFLTYEGQTSENGAEWAIDNGVGDCTEYSYLMVAMLRACGIPARVLRGLVLSTSGVADFNAPVNTEYNFQFLIQNGFLVNNNLTGHAWLEYFIPGYGWIVADPTWDNIRDYSKSIDNIHVPYTIGVWTVIDGSNTNEFSTIPYKFDTSETDLSSDTRFEFRVIEQQSNPIDIWIYIAIFSAIIGIALISIIAYKRRSSSKSYEGKSSSRIYFND